MFQTVLMGCFKGRMIRKPLVMCTISKYMSHSTVTDVTLGRKCFHLDPCVGLVVCIISDVKLKYKVIFYLRLKEIILFPHKITDDTLKGRGLKNLI